MGLKAFFGEFWTRRSLGVRPVVVVFMVVVALLAMPLAYRYYSTHFPRLERTLDGPEAASAGVWSSRTGGIVSSDDGMLTFSEDTAHGEHFLETRPFAKGNRTFVDITAEIETEDLSDIWLRVVSDGAAPSVWFQLGQTQHLYRFGALAGSLRVLADRSSWDETGIAYMLHRRLDLELSARFEIVGSNDRFALRLQGFRNGTTIYAGNGHSGWALAKGSIHILDTGSAISRLEPGSGKPTRLFVDAP